MAREGKAKVLTPEEFKRLLLIASDGQFPERNQAIIYCSFGLGLRVKEISSLKISDVADENLKLLAVINLKRSMTKGEKQRHAYLKNKKVCSALQSYLDSLEAPATSSPLFQTQKKSRFTPDVLQKWFKKQYDKAGIVGASSHSGRRTFITRLVEKGIEITAVSRLAGHSNIGTTAIYVDDNPDRLMRIAEMADI